MGLFKFASSRQASEPEAEAEGITVSVRCGIPSEEEGLGSKIVDVFSSGVTSTNSAWSYVNAYYSENQGTIENVITKMLTVQIDCQAAEEGMRVVANGLKALCKVHPFIGAAVLSFNAVVILHLKRRDNDKKVLAVHARIQDALSVLFHLRKMKHSDELGSDGVSVEHRMKHLMARIDKDIQETGSMCDLYRKKNCISKTVKATVYEHRFAEKATLFIQYRDELLDALSLHTALGVDAANNKLDRQQSQLDRMESKLDEMLHFFRQLDTPQEKDARKLLDDVGGAEKCLDSDEHVTELLCLCGSEPSAKASVDVEAIVAETRTNVLKELDEDLDCALNRHMQLFERKLEVQRQELEEAIKNSEKNIIAAMQSGAHERIRNEDLRHVWKEMNWRGSVKARHFVLALHDYYNDEVTASKSAGEHTRPVSTEVPDFMKGDKWALAYININHVQPILEAFDDDGTGFITIKEVNAFVESRPNGWSLPHWIAYWAAGWHPSIDQYKHHIYRLVQDMIKCARRTLPENRRVVDQYLAHQNFDRIELLLRSTRSLSHTFTADRYLSEAIDTYTNAEQKRLERALEHMAYEIDTPEVVSLVTGPGRIERFIFPLVYLLLRRQRTIVDLATEHILDPDEFVTMTTTLMSVFEVLDDRIEGLASVFRQAHVDVRGRFENFAFGMLRLSYDLDDQQCELRHNTLCTWQPTRSLYHQDLFTTYLDDNFENPLSVLKHQLVMPSTVEQDSSACTWHLGCVCDACNKEIFGERIMCLDCISDSYGENINLCSRCCAKSLSKGVFTHSPSHLMMKLHHAVFNAELAWMIPKARSTNERIKLRATSEAEPAARLQQSALRRSNMIKRNMLADGGPTARETFICAECERREVSISPDHSSTHTLLKLRGPQTAKPTSAEARLSSLESRLAAVESKLGGLEIMESRLAGIENLLQQLLSSKRVEA
ncbi:hypothetical protein VNI00_008448 [Paramarasmius palmivorus]|uniref:EF-hand domain-containing protein n=1 Tax=Paramarasmius palmivorus TaxID=297713 RepID=A0AAW0CY24_9AGAR